MSLQNDKHLEAVIDKLHAMIQSKNKFITRLADKVAEVDKYDPIFEELTAEMKQELQFYQDEIKFLKSIH